MSINAPTMRKDQCWKRLCKYRKRTGEWRDLIIVGDGEQLIQQPLFGPSQLIDCWIWNAETNILVAKTTENNYGFCNNFLIKNSVTFTGYYSM